MLAYPALLAAVTADVGSKDCATELLHAAYIRIREGRHVWNREASPMAIFVLDVVNRVRDDARDVDVEKAPTRRRGTIRRASSSSARSTSSSSSSSQTCNATSRRETSATAC